MARVPKIRFCKHTISIHILARVGSRTSAHRITADHMRMLKLSARQHTRRISATELRHIFMQSSTRGCSGMCILALCSLLYSAWHIILKAGNMGIITICFFFFLTSNFYIVFHEIRLLLQIVIILYNLLNCIKRWTFVEKNV